LRVVWLVLGSLLTPTEEVLFAKSGADITGPLGVKQMELRASKTMVDYDATHVSQGHL
jgi:hypothetical protein